MARELLLPELAESVVEGEILKWLVDEGDDIAQDQPVVEVMTDKVTVELPSPFAGRLEKRLVKEGDIVPVHAPIALFADEGAAVPEPEAPPPTAAEKSANPTSVPTPASPEPVTASEERSIIESGNAVEEDAGDAQSLFKAYGSAEEVRMPVRRGGGQAGPSSAEARAGTNEFGRVLAVPAARKLARERALDIAQVPGSGPNGRVRVDDVRRHLESAQAPAPAPVAVPAPAPQPVPTPAAPAPRPSVPSGLPVPPVQYRPPKGYEGLETRTPLRGLRRAISNQMLASHLYTVRTLTVDEADLTALVELRARLKPAAEAAGVKLTYLPFIFKALAAALKAHPALNSSLDEATQEIVTKGYYHIGNAVDTPSGLIVPVVKDVDRKSVLGLAREIANLAGKAREGKASPEELSGSTFSVTNIGSIGALFSFPIINVPDAAILGVHSIQDRPVVREGQVVVRKMMYLSLSFDHRLVDGAEAARFTKTLIRLLENPDVLLLEAI